MDVSKASAIHIDRLGRIGTGIVPVLFGVLAARATATHSRKTGLVNGWQ
jgi:hypothetical protein